MYHLKTCDPSAYAVTAKFIDHMCKALSATEDVGLSYCHLPYFSLEMTTECFVYLPIMAWGYLLVTMSWSWLAEWSFFQCKLPVIQLPTTLVLSSSPVPTTTGLRVQTSPANQLVLVLHIVHSWKQCICFIFLKMLAVWSLKDINSYIYRAFPPPVFKHKKFNIYYLN